MLLVSQWFRVCWFEMSLGVELARSPRRGLSWRAKELIVQETPAKVVDRLEERKSRETKEVIDVVLTPQERSPNARERATMPFRRRPDS